MVAGLPSLSLIYYLFNTNDHKIIPNSTIIMNSVRILMEQPFLVKFEVTVLSLAPVTEGKGGIAQSFGFATRC